jgi:phosphatidylserine/phosphatidylglycerophosphate/cardiolipin synthase-like enzyme
MTELHRLFYEAGSSPWRDGNRFRLFGDGTRFFDEMIAAIEAARGRVLLEMYLIESGAVATRFIDALIGAAARGATVAVLFDAFGALNLRDDDRRRLTEGGVSVVYFNSLRWRKRLGNFLRNHRKLLTVDSRVAFVGGAGLTDEFACGKGEEPAWRDFMVEIRGPVVADWETLFAATWRRTCRRELTPSRDATEVMQGGVRGRVIASAGWSHAGLADSVVQRMDGALRRVWVTSAYFVPSRRFRKALRRAVRRGADVRLLMPGPRTDHPMVRHAARRFFGKLLRNGVRIFEFQPRVLHAKMVICDDWVSIGSSNLDRWSFKWNLEANQEVDDPVFAGEAAAVFEADLAHSVELDRHAWRLRGRLDRAREWIAGFLDRTLERWRRPPTAG